MDQFTPLQLSLQPFVSVQTGLNLFPLLREHGGPMYHFFWFVGFRSVAPGFPALFSFFFFLVFIEMLLKQGGEKPQRNGSRIRGGFDTWFLT